LKYVCGGYDSTLIIDIHHSISG